MDRFCSDTRPGTASATPPTAAPAGRFRGRAHRTATTLSRALLLLALGAVVGGCAGRSNGECCPCQTNAGREAEAEHADGGAIDPAKYSQFPYSRISDAYDRALEWRVRTFARRGPRQARHAPALREYLMERYPKSRLFAVVARLFHEYLPLFDRALDKPQQLARDRDLAWALFTVRSFALDWSYQNFFKGTIEYRSQYLETDHEPPAHE